MRMGPHVMNPLLPGTEAYNLYREWVLAVRPPVVKFCRQGADPELMAWTRAQGSKVVLRWVDYSIRSSAAENGRTADRVLAECLPFAHCIDYIEFANEEYQGKESAADSDTLFDACLDFMQKLDGANRAAGRSGPKACIGNFSVGQPELARWTTEAALDCLRYADANDHAVGIHEYFKPFPWAMIEGGKAAWDGPPPAVGWLLLRCVQAVRLLRGAGVRIRFIITESGRDNVPGQPGEGGGFRDAPGEPYAEWMAEYGRHLSAIPECIGWVDFGFNAWEGWKQFDLTLDQAMCRRVIATQVTLPRGGSTSPGGNPVSDRLSEMLAAEFGPVYDDLRAKLATNPNGPNGGFGALPPERVDTIVLHHTAGGRDTTWEATALYHVQTRGFAGIGYHIGIRLGRVAYLGSVSTARAHVLDHNHHTIGVSVAGNYHVIQPQPEDLTLLPRLVKVLDAYFGRAVPWRGHRDVSPPGYTVCPGQYLYPVLPTLRNGTNQSDDAQLALALGKWADVAQAKGIQPNPGGALFKAIDADGFYVLTDESGARGQWPAMEIPGVTAQLARRRAGTEERIYYWRDGKVGWKRRGAA